MTTFSDLREEARTLGVPEKEINLAYDRQDLEDAVRRVDLLAAGQCPSSSLNQLYTYTLSLSQVSLMLGCIARRLGVPEQQIRTAYDHQELREAIKVALVTLRIYIVSEDGDEQRGSVSTQMDVSSLMHRCGLDQTRGLSLTPDGNPLPILGHLGEIGVEAGTRLYVVPVPADLCAQHELCAGMSRDLGTQQQLAFSLTKVLCAGREGGVEYVGSRGRTALGALAERCSVGDIESPSKSALDDDASKWTRQL